MNKVLIIDDEISVGKLLSGFLQKNGFQTESTISGKQGLRMLRKEYFDVILCDYRLGDFDGSTLYPEIRKLNPGAAVIFITGYVNLKVAIELVKKGVYYYLEKPLRPEELLEIIHRALNSKDRGRHYPNPTVSSKKDSDYVIGRDCAAKELMKAIALVGPTDYSVVIEGETGTGKESIAKMVHMHSYRNKGPFIPIDCGSLSKEIAASELFGHEKGAFTGAIIDKTGAFELADGGTLFLDEIANLSLDIQVMLLRAVQEQIIRKLGSLKLRKTNVRIIVATNEDLQSKVASGQFREDLYYRINEFNLAVPSLKERKKDLMLFVDHFIHKTGQELGKTILGIDEDVRFLFHQYSWPGNIRELKNVVRRACLLTDDGCLLGLKSLPKSLQAMNQEIAINSGSDQNAPIDPVYDTSNLDLKFQSHLAEAKHIQRVLNEVGNNKSKAAALLNIDRKTLYQKLKRFESGS